MALKSAMKHAFSVDFGLRNAVNVSGTGMGVGVRNESLWSACKRLLVSTDKGRRKIGGLKLTMAVRSVGAGMWNEPRLPSPFAVMSSVTLS